MVTIWVDVAVQAVTFSCSDQLPGKQNQCGYGTLRHSHHGKYLLYVTNTLMSLHAHGFLYMYRLERALDKTRYHKADANSMPSVRYQLSRPNSRRHYEQTRGLARLTYYQMILCSRPYTPILQSNRIVISLKNKNLRTD